MVFGLFNKKSTSSSSTNEAVNINQAGGEGGAPPIALGGRANATINFTDQGALEAATAISDRSFATATDALSLVGGLTETIAESVRGQSADAIGLARDRSQSEGSQQSESLIKLALYGTTAVAAVLIVPKVFR